MAPPLTLTFDMSGWCSFSHASTTGANASLISTRSISSIDIPARSSTFAVDGMGPVSINTGSTPATANEWKRARGFRPSWAARSSEAMRTAAAPSVIWDELPAVMTPSGLNAGLSVASFSTVLSGRIPSSALTSCAPSGPVTVTGTISRSKRPSSRARAARRCDSTAKRSFSSREIPHFSEIISAEMPWGTRSGYRARSFGPNGMPWDVIDAPIGTRVIDSTPAATTRS